MVLIVLLLLIDRFIVQPPLLSLLTDPSTINTAGRQRMLSQRMTKLALVLAVPKLSGGQRARSELANVLAVWSARHDDLRSRPASLVVREAFQDIEPAVSRMKSTMTRLSTAAIPSTAELEDLLQAEEDYLSRMERIVGLLERDARFRVDRLIWTGWIVAGLIALALVAIQFTLFEPATRLIDRQFQALKASHEVLEKRVRERTEEWEQSNAALRQEAAERRRADEKNRELLEQLSQVSRANTVGEMASGLAHELNQPLGSIANYAEGCLVALDTPVPNLDEIRGAIEKLLASTLRAGRIIHRIRRFVTRQDPIRETFDPNDAVREVASLLADETDRHCVSLQTRLAPDLPWITGDPVQIQQVLVNLVRNAIDAISATEPRNPLIVMETSQPDSRTVELRVSDNGEGIAEGQAAHVFDPFFSTRAEGMGMGLAICRTIVEAHDGRIAVESSPGAGAIFRLSFPTIGDDPDAASHGLSG
jgi:C4-dicarboxylate-specific signal transduction histidine kinase